MAAANCHRQSIKLKQSRDHPSTPVPRVLLHRTSRMPAHALCPASALANSTDAGDGAKTARPAPLHSHSKNVSGTPTMPDASHSPAPLSNPGGQLDVAIVGGGLAGVYAVHRLRGMGLKVRA